MFFDRRGEARPPPDKTVTFFNIPKSTLIRYAGKILDPPHSCPIQLVETGNGVMKTSIIEATEKKWTGFTLGSSQAERPGAYADALKMSRTFVIADSYFSQDSMLVDSEDFLKHGLAPMKYFYEIGGTVVVMCVEGIYAIGSQLNSEFGCEWHLQGVDNETCTPTEKGREYFGNDVVEKLYAGKGHFMGASEEEGLYRAQILDYEKYKHEHYGYCSDGEFSDDELDECSQAYERHVHENKTKFLLAVHENDKGGRIVWMGDRNQEDPKMRAVFAKLCCKEMVED